MNNMTHEEKELLLQDLCARFPYGVVLDVDTTDWKAPQGHIKLKIEGVGILFKDMSLIVNGSYYGDKYKPYLRSMSSMTEEEKREYASFIGGQKPFDSDFSAYPKEHRFVYEWDVANYVKWLNSHFFDYRGLIERGLAIEVTDENNPYKL